MINIKAYETQIEISKAAREALASFKEKNPEKFKKFIKWFHLRPGSGNVTIVTTHEERAMRGIKVGKTRIESSAEFLADCIDTDGKTINWKKIAGKFNAEKGFEKGTGNGNKEYPFQAKMINNLHDDKKLKKLIGVKNLFFIASEVVFSRGKEDRKKIDIVAHDGDGKVIFFEMKAPANERDKPVDQVNGYLELYGKDGTKNYIFEEMLKNYPQNPIEKITGYDGYGVIGYSDNLSLKGEKLIGM